MTTSHRDVELRLRDGEIFRCTIPSAWVKPINEFHVPGRGHVRGNLRAKPPAEGVLVYYEAP